MTRPPDGAGKEPGQDKDGYSQPGLPRHDVTQGAPAQDEPPAPRARANH
jgi:hypothetical protein